MDKQLALKFVEVTEAAAIASARWRCKDDKIAADQAAVDAMREKFNQIAFCGEVKIGEGEKDEAPLLYIGEKLGAGGEEIDIAVDPLECTSNLAKGKPNAISVLAAGPRGSLLKAPGTYMDQISVGPKAKGAINITKPVEENIKNIAAILNKQVSEITVTLLDRPRHNETVSRIKAMGAKVILFDHGTISAGIAPCISKSQIDIMMGIGGAPEAVITAAALKCLGGDMQGILRPHNDKFRKQAISWGMNLDKVYNLDDLAGDDVVFVATGVNSGSLLNGVQFSESSTETHSMLIMDGNIEYIKNNHPL